jgi:hypothetical protein
VNDIQLLRKGIAAIVREKRDAAAREADMWQHQPGSEIRVATERGRRQVCNEILAIVEES